MYSRKSKAFAINRITYVRWGTRPMYLKESSANGWSDDSREKVNSNEVFILAVFGQKFSKYGGTKSKIRFKYVEADLRGEQWLIIEVRICKQVWSKNGKTSSLRLILVWPILNDVREKPLKGILLIS